MECPISRLTLAAHVLRSMATAQEDGRRTSLDGLVIQLGVRRPDVRATLSQLHQEGLLDVLHMRLTLRGYALGRAFSSRRLGDLTRIRHATAA